MAFTMAKQRFGGAGGKLVRQLLAEFPEWTVKMTHRQHWRLTGLDGTHVFVAGTPSYHRALRNTRAKLKRAMRQQHSTA